MKNIAIVGCNKGIGLALTKKYHESGYNVFGFCRKKSTELESLQIRQITEGFDVSDFTKLGNQLKTSLTEKIDLLIHVSGILSSESLDQLNLDKITEQLKVNSLAPLATVKAFLPYLNESAKVGLLTSRMGSVEDNSSGGMYGYRMSKAALNMAGKSLAIDLQPKNITVLLLHPGYVKTDMTNNNGLLTPEESADGLFKIMKTKGLEQTGTFWHTNGETLPW